MLGPILQWVNKIYQNADVKTSTRASQTSVNTIENKVYDWTDTGYSVTEEASPSRDHTWVNISGAGYLCWLIVHDGFTSGDRVAIKIDGTGDYIYIRWGDNYAVNMFPLRFNSSLLVEADNELNNNHVGVILD